MVSIETVIPLQDSTPAEPQTKQLDLFYEKYGNLTVRTLTWSISLQDLGLHAASRVKEANM